MEQLSKEALVWPRPPRCPSERCLLVTVVVDSVKLVEADRVLVEVAQEGGGETTQWR